MATFDKKTLLEERKVLENDFNTTKERIVQVEKDLGNMKSNLNAVYGAIQQVDKLLTLVKPADIKLACGIVIILPTTYC